MIHRLESNSTMVDPRFTDPEQLQRVHQQKMDVMKVIMTEIIDNPSPKISKDLMKIVNYLDRDSNNNSKDD
jgi:hypothetical protein